VGCGVLDGTGQIPSHIESRWPSSLTSTPAAGGSGKLEQANGCVCGCRCAAVGDSRREQNKGRAKLGANWMSGVDGRWGEAGPRHPCCLPVSHPANQRRGWRSPLAAARDGCPVRQGGKEGNKRGLWNATSSPTAATRTIKVDVPPSSSCLLSPQPCPAPTSKLTTNPSPPKTNRHSNRIPKHPFKMKTTTILPLFAVGVLSQNFAGQPACAVRPPPSPPPPRPR
jgi:hypothetical protein